MQGGGGGGGDASQLNPVVNDPRSQLQQLKLGDPSLQVEEEASPISSRPPAMALPHSTSPSSAAAAGLFEDELLLAGERGRIEMAGGGNRWPRQETVALLKIRSDMDTTFRDANPKGPLWEEVSRKLGELGYKRSAKKCKEKFENVHKYYKRTKEGRAGRQDGKSYKFFTELEALAAATSSSSMQPPPPPTTAAITAGIGFSSPAPISSSIRFQPNLMFSVTPPPHPFTSAAATAITPPPDFNRPAATNIGISFSSDTNSSFANSDSSDSDQERKRKRTSPNPLTSTSAGNERMAEFFERLMNQVLQKQETMQQRFLEAIEKREHDRMIREEAWKRQEIIRLAKEQELIAQERAISASRDSAIITFLQKITGQTIQLPPPISMPPPPPPQPPPPSSSSSPIQPPPPIILSREVVMATTTSPEHQLVVPRAPHEISTSADPSSSSRWPKEEILALIEMRSRLEYRYQESGPKGPLWEEISAGMNRMGYSRNAKRCKEKWENINKYYKKVKESKKKRSEDTKTCPYYHQLDELYRNKILGTSSSSGVKPEEQQPQQHEQDRGDGLTANLFGEGSVKKPEDSVRGNQQEQQFIMGDYGKIDEDKSDDMDLDEDDVEEDDEDDDDDDDEDIMVEEEEMKMGYNKIEFQGQNNNTASSNGGGGGGNGAPNNSFLTMVQ